MKMKRFIRAIGDWWKGRAMWLRCLVVVLIVVYGVVPVTKCVVSVTKHVASYFNSVVLSEINENDSLAVYAQYGKRGYLDVRSGEVVISARKNDYTKAWIFSEGLAAVMKDGKVGFINVKNEVVIPFQFDYLRTWWFHQAYVFHDGYCMMGTKDRCAGVIDTTGRWVIEPVYDEIYRPHENGGAWLVVKDEMYGLYDADMNMLYPAEYDRVYRLSDGYALVKDGKKWQVDFEGNVVYPFMFDMTYPMGCHYGCEECEDAQCVATNYMKYKVWGSYGIMDRVTGKPITPAIYADVKMISEKLFGVQDDSECYGWHLLDINGNVVK